MQATDEYSKILNHYLPDGCAPVISGWIVKYNFNLKISKERNTKLGDYRSPLKNGAPHQISVNHNLNKYSFLITLIHEIAHLTNFQKNKRSVEPHGIEWKNEFRNLMSPFISNQQLPEDVCKALLRYLINPAASSCADSNLQRVLYKYDEQKSEHHVFIEKIPINATFIYNDRKFIKGILVRKRFKCKEIKNNNTYLFSPIVEVIACSTS